MHCRRRTVPGSALFVRPAPTLIAIGVAILLANFYWAAIPVVTAMALIALGATIVTIARLRATGALRAGVAAHALVYMSLYFLFVVAICDAAMRGPQDGLTFLQSVDFGVSAVVMSVVARMCFAAMAGGEDAPAR